jgi:hypothetical protein
MIILYIFLFFSSMFTMDLLQDHQCVDLFNADV